MPLFDLTQAQQDARELRAWVADRAHGSAVHQTAIRLCRNLDPEQDARAAEPFVPPPIPSRKEASSGPGWSNNVLNDY